MKRTHASSRASNAIDRPSGNFYYVRLKTPLGLFYKFGFTTYKSVEDRLAYQGAGHERLIDKVLCFVFMHDAYAVEQQLHYLLKKKKEFPVPVPEMPLFGNGQSELYAEDVLGFDREYTDEQAKTTRANVRQRRLHGYGAQEITPRPRTLDEQELDDAVALFARPVLWLVRIVSRFLNSSARTEAQVADLIVKVEVARRLAAQAELAELKRQLLQSLAKDDAHQELVAVEADVVRAISALNRNDLAEFENLVDIDAFASNLLRARYGEWLLPSELMRIANNCYLLNLLAAWDTVDPAEVVHRPVLATYRTLLRHYVQHGCLPTEELIIPNDSLYEVGEQYVEPGPHPLSDYYGPRSDLDDLGRKWSLPGNPAFRRGDGYIEFDITVENPDTTFLGALTIQVRREPGKRLVLSFPNFFELREQARQRRDSAHPLIV